MFYLFMFILVIIEINLTMIDFYDEDQAYNNIKIKFHLHDIVTYLLGHGR